MTARKTKPSTEAEATDKAPASEPDKEAPRSEATEVSVEYRGLADAIRIAGYQFRPGQPVTVRSEVVEELLTYPNERFVVVEE